MASLRAHSVIDSYTFRRFTLIAGSTRRESLSPRQRNYCVSHYAKSPEARISNYLPRRSRDLSKAAWKEVSREEKRVSSSARRVGEIYTRCTTCACISRRPAHTILTIKRAEERVESTSRELVMYLVSVRRFRSLRRTSSSSSIYRRAIESFFCGKIRYVFVNSSFLSDNLEKFHFNFNS